MNAGELAPAVLALGAVTRFALVLIVIAAVAPVTVIALTGQSPCRDASRAKRHPRNDHDQLGSHGGSYAMAATGVKPVSDLSRSGRRGCPAWDLHGLERAHRLHIART